MTSLFEVQEQERRWLSGELHDDLNQQLAAFGFEIDRLLARKVPEDSGLRPSLAALRTRVTGLAKTVRNLAYQLHPPTLDLGLDVALEDECRRFAESYGIKIEFSARRVPPVVPANVALGLYRVVQEALRNVRQHARAPKAIVLLEGRQHGIHLRITDFGIGFDASAPHRGGLGLLNMAERVWQLNGSWTVESRPGHGTVLEASVPLPEPRKRELAS
jgi:signal transduction histidine kinase